MWSFPNKSVLLDTLQLCAVWIGSCRSCHLVWTGIRSSVSRTPSSSPNKPWLYTRISTDRLFPVYTDWIQIRSGSGSRRHTRTPGALGFAASSWDHWDMSPVRALTFYTIFSAEKNLFVWNKKCIGHGSNSLKCRIRSLRSHCTLLKGVQQDTFVWETSHF